MPSAEGPSTYSVPKSGPSRGRSRGRGGASDAFRSRSPIRPTTSAWKTEADPDVVPQPPRFTPKRNPGVQPPLNVGKPSPGEIFSHFFDPEVLKVLCANTNKNAEKNLEKGKKFTWNEITAQEMQKYLGLLLYMAVMDFPRMTDFWRRKTIYHVAFPSTVMPRDRFLAIASHLHISDPSEDAENDQKLCTDDYDRLHRVRPLLDMMRNRCMTIYHPKQHIKVDDRMVAIKHTKWGLKFFVLADVNGYTIDFKLYTGKSKFASGKGLSYDVVTSLVNKDFLGSGYIVYCNNFYTSPHLFRHLGQQGFGACGTYKQGRVGVPSTQENALHKRSPKGSIRWIRESDLLFVKWKDTREVSICTNIHPVHSGETVLRWQRTDDGLHQMIPVPRPTAVVEYSKYMGGVDTSDRMLGTNSLHRKTKKWYINVFQHFLDIAVINSYIIHKELCASQQQKHMSRQDFQEELSAQLLGVPLDGRAEKTTIHDHFPVPTNNGQDKSQRASMGRRQCSLCKRSTPWKCEECNVGLCLQLERNCFREYHKGQQTPEHA